MIIATHNGKFHADVEDAVFCYIKRFVAAAHSKEGTLRLLQLALDAPTAL